MVLALNMFDIAERQGWRIDLDRLSRELDVPVVTTVATRKRGLETLLATAQRLARQAADARAPTWREPGVADLRVAHREAERIRKACVAPPVRPDTLTGKLDSVLLHPVIGSAILLAVLFFMFQAVFAWAQPVMDAIKNGFDALGVYVGHSFPPGVLRSLISEGRDLRRRQRAGLPAPDPDPVLLHHRAGGPGLHGPRGFPDGQGDGRRGGCTAAPSFRCFPASPAPFRGSWARG